MQFFPRTPEHLVEQYKLLHDSGIIVWHDKGRHGTILNIKPEHVNLIYDMLVYYYGNKCGWFQKNPDKTESVEFVHQTKTGRLARPWYWCGETILFKEWKEREDENLNLIAEFHLGDRVEFEYRGSLYRGFVSNIRKRLTIISEGRKFYMPASDVKKI